MVGVTRQFVTYGIRAGMTHDLGFTTGSVDMMVLIILLLIELLTVCRSPWLEDATEADDGVLGEEARRLQQHPHLRGLTPREVSRSLDRSRL
jgi:hypothetical protein